MSLQVTLVVATDLDGVIGHNNRMPWHLPADLRRFKQLTMGKPMILGRKTWESIGRPLPGRTSIVMTQRAGWSAPGALVAHSVEQAMQFAAEHAGPEAEVMVIGGAQVFAEFLPLASRIHWTQVQAHVGGETHIPAFDAAAWREVAREEVPADDQNAHGLVFIELERRTALP
jgi:dihydrofolate reductase